MFKFRLGQRNKPIKILCLGAHCDDIEIGCGGSLLRILEEYQKVEVYWIVFSSIGERGHEARTSAHLFLHNAAVKSVIFKDFQDGFFPYIGSDIKNYFEDLKNTISPDIIFTHSGHDLHQDHRLISELTWNTFRNHFILQYEIIKYDGDLGVPNLFIQLNDKHCRNKIQYLMSAFKSQRQRPWFTEDSFLSMMRIRGIESNAPEKFAEAFYCRKMVF